MPIASVGTDTMSWGEAFALTQALLNDPTSHVGASLAGWDHPASREALTLFNLFDLVHQAVWNFGGRKGSRPKPHPRPWANQGSRRAKPAAEVSQADVMAALRRAGHDAPVPTL